MKKFFTYALAFFVVAGIAVPLFFSKSVRKEKLRSLAQAPAEKPFVIIIPSYNNSAYCEHNLMSVLNQNYKNFRVIYIDDCSKDDTYEKVKTIVDRSPIRERVTLIRNSQNQGALKNLYFAIHTCNDEEIVATVDGDDFLAHTDVLKKLNKVYSDPQVWMTYGNYLDYPTYKQKPQICKPFPKSVVRNNSYRNHEWVSSHLRTFYAGLFKKITVEDFMFDGRFLPMGWDLAFMLPMLEMSGKHCHYVEDVLYLYNRTNPINDHKINLALQSACANHVRSKPAYANLQAPPYLDQTPHLVASGE
jgi:glycosyltransferase involved in cell wall biosynthesis